MARGCGRAGVEGELPSKLAAASRRRGSRPCCRCGTDSSRSATSFGRRATVSRFALRVPSRWTGAGPRRSRPSALRRASRPGRTRPSAASTRPGRPVRVARGVQDDAESSPTPRAPWRRRTAAASAGQRSGGCCVRQIARDGRRRRPPGLAALVVARPLIDRKPPSGSRSTRTVQSSTTGPGRSGADSATPSSQRVDGGASLELRLRLDRPAGRHQRQSGDQREKNLRTVSCAHACPPGICPIKRTADPERFRATGTRAG